MCISVNKLVSQELLRTQLKKIQVLLYAYNGKILIVESCYLLHFFSLLFSHLRYFFSEMLMKESLDKTSNALKLTRLDVYVFAHSLNNCNA